MLIEMPKIGISGRVDSWEVVNRDGSIAQSCYTSHKNTILNTGLDFFSTAYNAAVRVNFIQYCAIGTGTPVNPVPATDTILDAEVVRGQINGGINESMGAWTYAAYFADTSSANGADPYYRAITVGVQTPYGVLNGTYGEIGFAPSATGNLFSKYRILDELGNPTTVPITSEQQLRLKYTLTFSFTPTTPSAGTCYMKGISAEPLVEDFAFSSTWQSVSSSTAPIEYLLSAFSSLQDWGISYYLSDVDWTFSDIGVSRTYAELGINQIAGTSTIQSYVAGQKYIIKKCVWETTVANWTNRCVSVRTSSYIPWLAKFTVPIVKANTHRLTINLKFSWDRV